MKILHKEEFMKRKILALILALGCLFSFSACGGDDKTSDSTPPVAHTHTYTQQSDDTYHWTECECGETTEKIAHDYTVDAKDGSHHWKKCSCGRDGTKTAHTYEIWYAEDASQHWKKCSCGADGPKSAHNYNTPDNNAEEHYMQCECTRIDGAKPHTTESIVEDGKHWTVCTDENCDYRVEANGETGHTYTEYGYDDNGHWQICACGAKTTAVPHSVENVEWNKDDDTQHWKSCACGKKFYTADHTFENTQGDDEEHWEACSECGATRNETAHSYQWVTTDDKKHWKVCSCGKKEEGTESEHSYGSDGTCECGKTQELWTDFY